MKPNKNLLVVLMLVLSMCTGMMIAFSFRESPETVKKEIIKPNPPKEKINVVEEEKCCDKPVAEIRNEKGCVFKTFFGEESSDSNFIYKTPQRVKASIGDALDWIMQAQLNNGGWGAGSHSRQDITDPHAVKADPATTAIVAMAILRTENKIVNGKYSANLERALQYLLNQVENSAENELNITDIKGTQPQAKLGQNIDVVLTSQFLTNITDYLSNNPQLKNRVKQCNQICVAKIQKGQNANGSLKGAGWAGVLQSSFANNAVETAKEKGVKVNEQKLEESRNYQMKNFDAETNSISTEDAAGIMLYSVSGSARASAKEARVAREKIETAKKEGKVAGNAPVSVDNLKKAGLSESEAMKYGTAYEVNQAAKQQAQRDDVMSGFGNNGGEEFLSYLQTGEGMIMNKDAEWKKWYDNITGRLVKIQNNDGSWNGHHCITSPVFCTATSLLILSVNNDVERLIALGGK